MGLYSEAILYLKIFHFKMTVGPRQHVKWSFQLSSKTLNAPVNRIWTKQQQRYYIVLRAFQDSNIRFPSNINPWNFASRI